MKRLIHYTLFSFLLLNSLTAQVKLTTNELYQKNLEENGTVGLLKSEGSMNTMRIDHWYTFPTAPEPFGRSIGGKIGDYIYIFGGQADKSTALAYNVYTHTWMPSTVCNAPAYNSSFCTTNTELYKLSGTDALSIFEKFTPDGTGTGTWTILTSGPEEVMTAQSTMAWDGGNYIYVYSSDYTSLDTSYFSRYNISEDSWINLTPPDLKKRYAGLSYVNGYLYLVGGIVPLGGDMSACVKYDPTTDSWNSIPPFYANFCKWSTTKVKDYVVVVGSGGNYGPFYVSPYVAGYNTKSNKWVYLGTTPRVTGLALGFSLQNGGQCFYGGGCTGSSPTDFQNTSAWRDVLQLHGTGGKPVIIPNLSLNYSVSNNKVALNWTVFFDADMAYFEVQRSADGKVYQRIGIVNVDSTINGKQNYNFTDNNPLKIMSYYRVKLVDQNGGYGYSEILKVEADSKPNIFKLSQNYPNPFNPTTYIEYSIPKNGFVRLNVYNTIGEKVANLVNENKNAGNHHVTFNASQLPSGIYFYKMKYENMVDVKKMILIK